MEILGNTLDFLNKPFIIGSHIKVSIIGILIIIITFLITSYVLKFTTKIFSNRLTEDNRLKFNSLFVFIKYFIYVVVGVIVFQEIGINVTPILAASTALLVGVGLAMQTLFEDIISGMFILLDETIKVGDIIEFDDRVIKVEDIKLRTTRAVTIDNKMMIIPNHHFLTNSLYNWTQNNKVTNDSVTVGVAYDSDVNLVKALLIEAVSENTKVLKNKEVYVFFEDFGDSSLVFRVRYAINNGFSSTITQSEIRFKINELFRKNNISIPYPQRDVHIIGNDKKVN